MQSNPSLKDLLKSKSTKYIPHVPTPKQEAFLWLQVLDAFYGGAAGGGKSDALLMASLQYVDVPNYAALLLRDTYTNLTMPGALMSKAEEWLEETDAEWSEQSKTWTFPSGATLTFGYLSGPRDHLNYKSAEFQFIGIDEAGDLRWKQINYMFSRLRKLKGHDVPLRFRLASNPGGISHEELKRKYIDSDTREEKVIFIPAGLDDNPYLDKEEYEKALMNLDPIERARLMKGDWSVRESGNIFKRAWFKYSDEAPVESEKIRYWDLAATKPIKEGHEPDWTVGVKMSKTKDGLYYIEDVVRTRESPRYVESLIRQTADIDGRNVTIYMEQEPGSSGVNSIDNYRRRVLPEFNFKADKVTGNKIDRAKPLSSQAEAGNVFIVKGVWNKLFIDEIEMFPEGKFKDQVDATSGAFNKLAPWGAVKPNIRMI